MFLKIADIPIIFCLQCISGVLLTVLRSILFWGVWALLIVAFVFLSEEGTLEEYFGPDIEIFVILLMVVVPMLPFIPLIFESFSALFGLSKSSLLFGSGKEAERILQTGIPAEATVISLSETDRGTVTINDQPYLKLTLQVDDSRSEAYTLSFNTIIPRASVPLFQPGSIFSVMVDSEDREKLVIVSGGSGPDDWISFGQSENASPKLGKNGVAATARLLSISDTGRSTKFKPIVKMEWEIAPHGKRPYKVVLQEALPTALIRNLESRRSSNPIFNARIHPSDKSRFEVCIS